MCNIKAVSGLPETVQDGEMVETHTGGEFPVKCEADCVSRLEGVLRTLGSSIHQWGNLIIPAAEFLHCLDPTQVPVGNALT
jgi:hypothetical protein